MSMMGRRALVTMKHVGLNVAADPFINSALLALDGGLVVAVADDPGMHSSQNEQDTRILADFARVPCLEPADQQEAYDMTREAFDLSERFGVPVVRAPGHPPLPQPRGGDRRRGRGRRTRWRRRPRPGLDPAAGQRPAAVAASARPAAGDPGGAARGLAAQPLRPGRGPGPRSP